MPSTEAIDADIKRSLDKELAEAVDTSFRRVNGSRPESRTAVEQLDTATQGLVRIEQELDELLQLITGHPEDTKTFVGTGDHRPEGLPMFDRVRSDATVLAELAIRMHAKIAYARERL